MIQEFLDRHQMTQYRLAQLTGVPQPTLKRWRETGPKHPELVSLALRQLAADMKKATYYILPGEDETWIGPITCTEDTIQSMAERQRCNGDRWARVFEHVPESDDREACIVDIGNGDIREVPTEEQLAK